LSAHYVPNERLRQCGCSVGAVWQMHGYILCTSGRFRLYLQIIASRNNQETALSAGLPVPAAKSVREDILDANRQLVLFPN